MTTRPTIRAVVFDFDGVIADSEPIHERALLETLKPKGLGFTHEEYEQEIIGYDDRDAFRAIYRKHGRPLGETDDPPSDQIDALIAEKLRVVHRLIAEGHAAPFPGTLDIARHAQDSGLAIAICSGALQDEIRRMLDVFGAADLFEIIVAADDVPKAKPDPAGYRMASDRLGIEPAACACIEDTPHGIAAAQAAGYGNVVAVTHSLPAAELGQADSIVSSTAEITLDHLRAVPTRS
ncbi:MAG: HAD family phosphatase [Planctomycetota bacterium]